MSKKTKKILKISLLSIISIILVALIALYAMFHKELNSINSITKVNDYPLYTMTYDGDYGFDDFLETGASTDAELVDFVVDKLLKGLPIEINIPSLGCSTFSVENEDGDRLFGRNFDLSYSPGMLVRTKPNNGYESISMVNLGFLGYGEDKLPEGLTKSITALAAPYAPLDGINEKGLTVGVLLIPTEETNQQSDKVDITTTTAIRMILDKAATVDEAINLLEQYDMHSSANSCYHFHIADADGNSVVVEYINNEISLVEPSESYQAATNFLLTPGDYDFGKGQDRYEILMNTLKENNGVLNEKEAMDLLKAVSQEAHDVGTGRLSSTQWSAVYNSKDLSVTLVSGMDFENQYTFKLFEG